MTFALLGAGYAAHESTFTWRQAPTASKICAACASSSEIEEIGHDQVIGQTLLVVAEEGVPTGGEVRLFHQPGKVFDGGGGEVQEARCSGQVFAEPAAEWVGSRFSMEETPSLAGGGVVAFVELLHQIVAGLAFNLLSESQVQHCWAAVGLLVDLVDCAMAYRHFVYLGQAPPSGESVVAIWFGLGYYE